MRTIIDLTGRKFNKLIVIKLFGQNYWGMAEWLCKCDCGKETVVLSNHLRRGNTKSCGCLHKESASKLCKKRNVKNKGNPLYQNRGINHPNFIDGTACGRSTIETLELKELIRKRDNYTCQDCGITQKEHKKKYNRILDVHHIDGDDVNNVKENMITLCRSCHNNTRKLKIK